MAVGWILYSIQFLALFKNFTFSTKSKNFELSLYVKLLEKRINKELKRDIYSIFDK